MCLIHQDTQGSLLVPVVIRCCKRSDPCSGRRGSRTGQERECIHGAHRRVYERRERRTCCVRGPTQPSIVRCLGRGRDYSASRPRGHGRLWLVGFHPASVVFYPCPRVSSSVLTSILSHSHYLRNREDVEVNSSTNPGPLPWVSCSRPGPRLNLFHVGF